MPKALSTREKQTSYFTNPLSTTTLPAADLAERYEERLQKQQLIRVTGWTHPEMGLSKSNKPVEAAVTKELWKSLVNASPTARTWQTVRTRGGELLWVASYALRRARAMGHEAAAFQVCLPTDDEEVFTMLRIEYAPYVAGRGSELVVLGYPEDFLFSER